MQKSKEPLRSPSITPHSTSSKQNISKKKPPAHTKPKAQDLKNLKSRSRTKKNRTNSITPKTLKSSICGFHNSNLSDTDISSKIIEVSRPSSKINKSLINRLELTQKVKEIKKPATFIDQIIKKSLNKAKKLRQSQEKENKKVEIKKEIKKQEMNYHNQQIRLENSLKYKKRKKSLKKPEHVKVRSESSSKVRNYASLFIDPAAKNKRSVSIGEYYPGHERRSETAIIDYIQDKNKRRLEEENFEHLHQRAAEISKAERLHNLELFTKNQRLRSPPVRKSNSKSYSENEDYEEKHEEVVQRNISFIEDSELESISQDDDLDENEEKPTVSDYGEVKSGRNGNLGVYSEPDSLDDPQFSAALIIQREFRKYLIHKLLKKKNSETKKNSLNIHYTKPLSVTPKAKPLKIDNQLPEISIFPAKKKLSTETHSFVSLNPKPYQKNLTFNKSPIIQVTPVKKKANLHSNQEFSLNIKQSKVKFKVPQISPQYNFTIFPDKANKSDSGAIHDQLKEQIAWNSAQIFIIEQLRCEEISNLSNLIQDESIREKALEKVHQKYSTLISVMKEATEFSQSDYLENLSVDEYSKFEKNKQNKQELLHKVLIDSEETLPKTGFFLNLDRVECSDQGVQHSSDLSSDDGEIRMGISHSRSLSQLHGDANVGKYVGSAQGKDPAKFPIFFEQDDAIEVQSINLITANLADNGQRNLPCLPSLGNLPMLHLDLMNKDGIYSEPRILTSTDSVLEYVKGVIKNLEFSGILNELRRPLERNVDEELFKLQEKVVGTPSETKILDFPLLLNYEEILSIEASSSELETTLRQINKADKIHKKMLLHVLNVQLQQFRPNGFEGKPLIWSNKSLSPGRSLKIGEITEKVLRDIEVFSLFQIGRIFNEEMMTSNGGIDEGIIQSLREDRLERLIYFETVEEENEWVDYEFEESQVKFDIADMILESLADEVEELLEQSN
jgi:hypothetical protein